MKKTAFAAAALAIAPTLASALTITYTTNDTGTTILPPQTTNWSTPINIPSLELPKFDPALGTLNSVTIDYEGIGEFAYKIENIDTATGTTGSNELLVDLTFTPSVAAGGSISVSSGVLNVNLGVFDGAIDFAGTSGQDFGTTSASDTFSEIITTGLAAFIGAGNFIIDVAAGSGSDRNLSGGNVLEQTTWLAGARAAVTYDYTAQQTVPEPATFALMGLGLLGFARFGRKSV